MEISRYMEKLDKNFLSRVNELVPTEQHPPSPADIREHCKLYDDKEVIDFLLDRIEATSGKSGNVCTCDDNNYALRAFQKAYDSAEELCYYRNGYKAYVDSKYGSDRSYYKLVWHDDDIKRCSQHMDTCLDDLCKNLDMTSVGEEYTAGYSKYADLNYAVTCIDESEEEQLDLPMDEINWIAMCNLAINIIVKEHLARFIDRAFKEQLEYL